MVKKILFSAVFTWILLMSDAGFGQTSVSEEKSRKYSRREVVRLFNRKNLDGWYTFIKGKGKNKDPNRVFTIKNRKIRISGEEFGCITSVENYENYRLIAEFKWGIVTHGSRLNKARDSGILLHSRGEDGAYGGIWKNSIECQLIEGGTGDLLVVGDGSTDFSITCPVAPQKQGGSYVFQPSGNRVTINGGRINWFGRDPEWKDVKDFRGAKDLEKPVGRWNRIECDVRGDEISVYLNGTLVNKAYEVKPDRGQIQIQSEGAELFFRRIDLVPLKQ